MDLLFKRYASPFVFVNQMIEADSFSVFVNDILEISEDEKLWEYYLHKVDSMSFTDYKASLQSQNIEPIAIEATVNDSYDVLQDFVPE